MVSFSLDVYGHEGEPSTVEFTPGNNANLLADFLQHAIEFEAAQAPMFLAKLIESLHAEEEDEEAEHGDAQNAEAHDITLPASTEAVGVVGAGTEAAEAVVVRADTDIQMSGTVTPVKAPPTGAATTSKRLHYGVAASGMPSSIRRSARVARKSGIPLPVSPLGLYFVGSPGRTARKQSSATPASTKH